MGFVYHKPLSIEQIFATFDKNGDGKISHNEFLQNKNSIFEGFSYTKDMTLKQFEEQNLEAYQRYELLNTRAWAEKAKNSKDPAIQEMAYKALQAIDDAQVEIIDKLIAKMLSESEASDVSSEKNSPSKEQKEKYVVPDPTMCRDPENNDW